MIHKNAPDVAFREIGNLFIASFARPSFEVVLDQETVDKLSIAALCRMADDLFHEIFFMNSLQETMLSEFNSALR